MVYFLNLWYISVYIQIDIYKHMFPCYNALRNQNTPKGGEQDGLRK